MLTYQKPSKTACLWFRKMIEKDRAVMSASRLNEGEARDLVDTIFREAEERARCRMAQRAMAMKTALSTRVSM